MVYEFAGVRPGIQKTIIMSVSESPTKRALFVELSDGGNAIVSTNLGTPDVDIADELDGILVSMGLAERGSVNEESFRVDSDYTQVGLPLEGEVRFVGLEADRSEDYRLYFVEGETRTGDRFGVWFDETIQRDKEGGGELFRASSMFNHLPQCFREMIGEVAPVLAETDEFPTDWMSVDCECPQSPRGRPLS